MPHKLDGMTIAISESRELDLFATLLEVEGAAVVRCPLVTVLDVEDATELDVWIRGAIAHPLDDLVLFTGEGLRRLVRRADTLGVRDEFVEAVRRTRTIIRGPKPARALREIGMSPSISAAFPTSRGLVAAIDGEDLRARRVGVQLYPGGGDLVVDALRKKGARVETVTPYRYASATDAASVAETIRRMAAGDVDVIAFTSSPQVERLVQVAKESALEDALSQGFRRTRVAAIGPVVHEALKSVGVDDVIMPANDAFHLKPLVRAISLAWEAQRQRPA